MKNIQMKYNFMHIFFWLTYCAIYGYIAVLLQFKGMTNTFIGVTSGLNCALTIISTPFVSGLIGKVKGLSIKNLITINYLAAVVLWFLLVMIPMPQLLIMLLFIICGNLMAVNVPLLTMICMNYLTDGQKINFGLSRGLGSVSYAASAVVFGILIERINPTILCHMFIAGSIGILITLFSLPEVDHKKVGKENKSLSMAAFIRKYRAYVLLLFGIALQFAAATSLSTYLINIVKNLGGTTSLYGIAVFCMAASELPFMAITPWLKERIPTEVLMLFAAVMYVARNVTIATASSLPILMIGMALQGLSYGIFTASITYYVHEVLDLEDGMMGQTMIAVMTTGLGSTIGNVLGGVLQDALGLDAMLYFAQGLTIVGLIIFSVVTIKSKRFNANNG